MNFGISILFRAIPLLMAAVCLGFGLYVLSGGDDAGHIVAGRVLISLTAICIALFTTAAMIIRQLTNTFAPAWKFVLPVVGYGVALATVAWGLWLRADATSAPSFVAGHVVWQPQRRSPLRNRRAVPVQHGLCPRQFVNARHRSRRARLLPLR
jgi:hypothetical protein